MALLERVGTLLRANLNDLIDKAEDPEKMLRQLVLDMENQLLQVKTQVAIALADQHLLERRKAEAEQAEAQWRRKAETAVDKGRDELARAALERALAQESIGGGFAQQLQDQKAEAENLRSALRKLQAKLEETRARAELMMSEHRRARAVERASAAHSLVESSHGTGRLERIGMRIARQSAHSEAAMEMLGEEPLEEKFAAMEREDKVEALLREIKERKVKSA
jgi:phage shock protein A